MKKRILAMAMVLTVAVGILTGCGGGNGEEKGGTEAATATPASDSPTGGGQTDATDDTEKTGIKIGLLVGSYELEFCRNIRDAIKANLREGDQLVDFVFDWTVDKLVTNMETMVNSGYDVIVYDAFDPDAVEDVVKTAHDKGITLIDYDFEANDLSMNYATIITDDYQLGYQLGEALAKACDYKGDVGVWGRIETSTQKPQKLRLQGFEDAIAQYTDMAVTAHAEGSDASASGSLPVIESTFQANPNLAGFASLNEGISISAASAIASGEYNMKFVSVDCTEILLQMIKDDKLYAAIDQQSYKIGETIAEYIYKWADGVELTEEESYVLVGVETVDATNYQEYLNK